MTQPTLAIETSQRHGGVALLEASDRVRVERFVSSRHDDALMPTVERLFQAAGLPPRALTAVGVSVGPGSFTGLRIAVTTAKMLAMAVGARVVAVPSALVVAESGVGSEAADGPVLVTLAAKGETAWATRLDRLEGQWKIVPGGGDGGSVAGGALLEVGSLDLSGVRALIGDRYLPESFRRKAAQAGVPVIAPRFEAEACLRITRDRLEAGRVDDARSLAPIYPRPPEAVSIWERRHGSATTAS